MDRQRPRLVREAAMVAAAMAALYLLTLTSNHTEADDAMAYAVGIQAGHTESSVLHAHHLLWGAIGWVGHNAALALGFGGGALEVLQVQNALTGAIGIGALWWWLRSIGWPLIACVSACGVLGFSYSYWFYSSETEVYVLSAALLVWCLAAAHRAALEPTVRNFALLGFVNGLAVFAHDTNVLFAAVVAVVLVVFRNGAPVAELARRGAAYAAVAVALVLPAYTAAALVNGHDSPRQAWEWIIGYTHSSEWGETRGSQLPKAVAGVSRSLVGGQFVFSNDSLADPLEDLGGRNPREERFLMRDFPPALAVVLLVLTLAIAGGVIAAVVAARRRRAALDASGRTLAIVCVAWAAIYGAFNVWWDPLNVEFWIVVWIPLAVLVSLPFSTRTGPAPRRAWLAVAALVGGLLVVNLAGSILPQTSEDDDYWRARIAFFEREATERDLVVTSNYHQTAYIAYYVRVPTVDAARLYNEAGRDRRALVAEVRGSVDVWGGDRVFVSREAFDPAADPWSNCKTGDQCDVAEVLRPELEPSARVAYRDEAETVWQMERPLKPRSGAPPPP